MKKTKEKFLFTKKGSDELNKQLTEYDLLIKLAEIHAFDPYFIARCIETELDGEGWYNKK